MPAHLAGGLFNRCNQSAHDDDAGRRAFGSRRHVRFGGDDHGRAGAELSGSSTSPARTTCPLANASSRQISQSQPGARSSRVVHNMRILMKYLSCEYAISTQGPLALMASTRSGMLWL